MKPQHPGTSCAWNSSPACCGLAFGVRCPARYAKPEAGARRMLQRRGARDWTVPQISLIFEYNSTNATARSSSLHGVATEF